MEPINVKNKLKLRHSGVLTIPSEADIWSLICQLIANNNLGGHATVSGVGVIGPHSALPSPIMSALTSLFLEDPSIKPN